jgi:predicted deacylase
VKPAALSSIRQNRAAHSQPTPGKSAVTESKSLIPTAPGSTGQPPPSPNEVFESIEATYRSPSVFVGTSLDGYTWNAQDLDEVMRQFSVGDALSLIRTAIALHRGDQYLSKRELVAAARRETSSMIDGFSYSPVTVRGVMREHGLIEETALLREARKHDLDGNRRLSRAELESAARVLDGIVKANDYQEILSRSGALQDRPELEVEELGQVGGQPIHSLHFACKNEPPKLRLFVSGGVHGNEPCGAAAAMLLVEQLLADPSLLQEVSVTIVPVVNPSGLARGTRRNETDVDLNRQFQVGSDAPEEVRLISNALRAHPPDLAVDFHSGKAKRDGFFALHENAEHLLAPAFEEAGKRFPLLRRETKPYHLTSPGVAVSKPGQTLKSFAIELGAKWAVTLEAPGSVSYLDQVLGQNELLHAIVEQALPPAS